MYIVKGLPGESSLYPYPQSLLPEAGKISNDATIHHPQEAFLKVIWGQKIGEGANAVVFKCKLRGVTCVAKRLKKGMQA